MMNLILGTMSFGEQIFGENAGAIIKHYIENGYCEIDTAYVYNGGQSEIIVGEMLKKFDDLNLKVATKVNPRVTGRLDKDAVHMQFNESLKRMEVDKVDTLYLHFPDLKTPIEYPLEACAELYFQGKFGRLGLSNFPAWLVADVYYRCKKHGWMLPKVYEGLYNPLSRKAEIELNSALNEYDMSFYAYNPLAGGLLTNKYTSFEDVPIDGRFTSRPNYKNRYWKKSFFEAVERIKEVCRKEDMDIVKATYCWLAYHSMLDEQRGDGIILGVSGINQLQQNIRSLKNGKLSEEIIMVFEQAWEISKKDAPEYFRFYGTKSFV